MHKLGKLHVYFNLNKFRFMYCFYPIIWNNLLQTPGVILIFLIECILSLSCHGHIFKHGFFFFFLLILTVIIVMETDNTNKTKNVCKMPRLCVYYINKSEEKLGALDTRKYIWSFMLKLLLL